MSRRVSVFFFRAEDGIRATSVTGVQTCALPICGGMHQVKPWFEGRLDFAPVIAFGGDEEFPLQGGAVGYFLDRKAAVFVFHRRLHAISLFVFRAEGLPWPTRGLTRVADAEAHATVARGFTVMLWRSGGLGYALVSDVNWEELTQLAVK